MHFAKKLTSILIFTITAVAGCTDAASVSGPERTLPILKPAFDGIGTAGSGNRSDSTQTDATITEFGSAVDSDSGATNSGVGTAGSGN